MLRQRLVEGLRMVLMSLALTGVLTAVGRAQEGLRVPRPYVHSEGRYAVEFPRGTQVDSIDELSAGAQVEGMQFFVQCTDVTGDGTAAEIFDASDASAMEFHKARIVRRTVGKFGNLQGHEVEASDHQGWDCMVRHFLVGKRYYLVGVMSNKQQLDRVSAKRFLDSFGLVERAPDAAPAAPIIPAPAPPAPIVPAPPAQVVPALPARQIAPPPPADPVASRRYNNQAHMYHIDFPGEPREYRVNMSQGRNGLQIQAVRDEISYTITSFPLSAEDVVWFQTQPDTVKITNDHWRDQSARSAGLTVVSDRQIQVAGHSGGEIEWRAPDGSVSVGRIVVFGGRCYRLVVGGMGVSRDDPRAQRFFESFGIDE
jgi:hypothetical protein